MNNVCSICGKKLFRIETAYRLHRDYPDELVCDDCVACLKKIRMHAKSGSSLYKAARKELIGILNYGDASENAMDYCDSLITRLNDVYASAAANQDLLEGPPPEARREQASKIPASPPSPEPDGERDREVLPQASPAPIPQRLPDLPDPKETIPPVPQQPVGLSVTIRCNSCGAENLADSMFCETCAAPLKEAKYCRFCGGRVSLATGICESCSRDRNGDTHTPRTPERAALSYVSDAGRKVASSAANVGKSVSSKGWIPWLCAAMALVMGLMLLGKMISVPALSLLSDNDSFSFFEISKIGGKASGFASFAGMDDQAGGLKLLSGIVILAVLGIMATFVSTIVAAFRDWAKAPDKLGTACKTLLLFLLICLLAIYIVNGVIKEEMDGWIDTVIEPTGLMYVLLVLAAVIAFFVSKELQYQTAESLRGSGDFQSARELFADLGRYKDSNTILEGLPRESGPLAAGRKDGTSFKCEYCGSILYGKPERCDVCGQRVEYK